MSTQELEQEVNDGLLDLSKRVSSHQLKGSKANVIQKMTDSFLIDWSGKLTEQREALIKDSLTQAQHSRPEVGASATPFQEHGRAVFVIADHEHAQAIIKDHIHQLRFGLLAAVSDIQKGLQPERIKLVTPEMDNELKVDGQAPIPIDNLSPARVSQLKAVIARQRTQTKKPESDRGDHD